MTYVNYEVSFDSKLDRETAVECQNCDWRGSAGGLSPIENFDMRVAPGEVCPAGQCTNCGALAHLIEPVVRLAVVLDGGLVQDVVSDKPEKFARVEVLVIDYDSEGVEEGDLIDVTQDDGATVQAFTHFESVQAAKIDLCAVFSAAEEK